MNTKQKEFYKLLNAIHYQTARGQHTWSNAECGHMARGGIECASCLWDKVKNLLGANKTETLSNSMYEYSLILNWVDEELE